MNDNKPAYTVVRTEDNSSYDVQRGVHRTKRTHFQMADGTRSYVELPIDQFTPEIVQQHIEQAVATHQAVMQLKPGQPPQRPDDSQNPWG